MVEALVKHNIKWLAPSPLWAQNNINVTQSKNGAFNRPAILRFNNDLFMEELLALTAYQPDRLEEWLAQPETWREPMLTPPTTANLRVIEPVSKRLQKITRQTNKKNKTDSQAATSPKNVNNQSDSQKQLPFKLYQPAHQRFYLVTAALICHRPGFPDRNVNPGKQEKASFVIRRIMNQEQDANDNECDTRQTLCREHAFVNTSKGYAWKPVEHDKRHNIQYEEERLPLFTINFDDVRCRRRLFAGLIPVGKRETYLAAPELTDADTNNEAEDKTLISDPRRILFESEVIAPWKALVEKAAYVKDQFPSVMPNYPEPFDDPPGSDPSKGDVLKSTREQIQTGSWYILLDFANFLENHLPEVWKVIKDSSKKAALDANPDLHEKSEFINTLQTVTIKYSKLLLRAGTDYTNSDIKIKLTEALVAIKASVTVEEKLEKVVEPYDRAKKNQAAGLGWPSFLFPLADPGVDPLTGGPTPDIDTYIDEWPEAENLDRALAKISALTDLVEAALDESLSPLPEMERIQEPSDNRDAWFIIRCVYERPNCGQFNPEVLSEPTQPFQMAPFFDPDAPARPVRIPMPIDISPAGLRKFKKNATFMISDMLCGKIKKIRKLTLGDLVLSVLPWPFHKDLPSVGPTGPCKDKGGGFGMFCSLSIPIVTLCALILLIIMVKLFDTFFRWIPYLFTCLPIPGFKGKKP
jgi:hypothetical protein